MLTKDITLQSPLSPPRKRHTILAMNVYQVAKLAFFCLGLYERGPVRFGGSFEYVPPPPAPATYSYAATVWYYLSHRQCFNTLLGIVFRLYIHYYVMALFFPGFTSIFRGVNERFNWWERLLLVLPPLYLVSGLLTARDAHFGQGYGHVE
jgi:hypothetical protein